MWLHRSALLMLTLAMISAPFAVTAAQDGYALSRGR